MTISVFLVRFILFVIFHGECVKPIVTSTSYSHSLLRSITHNLLTYNNIHIFFFSSFLHNFIHGHPYTHTRKTKRNKKKYAQRVCKYETEKDHVPASEADSVAAFTMFTMFTTRAYEYKRKRVCRRTHYFGIPVFWSYVFPLHTSSISDETHCVRAFRLCEERWYTCATMRVLVCECG